MILAGDVGGTKTNLALFKPLGGGRVGPPLSAESIRSGAFPTLEALLLDYRARHPGSCEAACFGVAGAVVDTRVISSNLPWTVEGESLARALGLGRVALINDLVATGYGIEALKPDELAVVQPGVAAPDGNAGLLAAGTGLGESILVRVGGRFLPVPSEAGHADFAPRTDAEVAVFRVLRARYGRVCYERVLSGPGLVAIAEILHRERGAAEAWRRHAAAAPEGTLAEGTLAGEISRLAIQRGCEACGEALSLFVGVYGAEAGNVALRAVARGGIYLGGGIAPKILAALQGPVFIEAFRDKDHLRGILSEIPVWVILNEHTAVLGAARYAATALN